MMNLNHCRYLAFFVENLAKGRLVYADTRDFVLKRERSLITN